MTALSASTPEGGTAGLDAPLPIDWRGQPLSAVLGELSGKLGVPHLMDASVPAEALGRPLRMYAAHLNGRQAFRWAARLAGLEAVIRDQVVFIAAREKLPRVWRLTGGLEHNPAADQDRLEAIAQRRTNLAWLDTPLGAVARSVSTEFGVDVVFHPQIVSDEGLVRLEQADAGLDAVRSALEDQLTARTAFLDGALWVAPAGLAAEGPATRPAGASVKPLEPAHAPPRAGPLDRLVVIDRSVRSWADFSERISQAAGITCRLTPAEAAWKSLEARGSVREVLDSAQMLGRLTWRMAGSGGRSGSSIEIRPGHSGS